jgi:outer membrane protein assembly factor BamD
LIQSEKFKKIIRFNIVLCLLLLFIILNGCSLFSKKDMPKASPEMLYASASAEYKEGNYKKSQELFLRLKEEYPLHELAVLAEIGIADSLISDKEYASAVDAYGDFISLHPVNENVPYAIYQMGMCHYNQMEAIDRDQTETVKARKEFEKVMARYPESKFSPMAEKILLEVKQKLAQREFYVGNFYLKQKKYQAALARFERIAVEYPNVGFDHKIEYYISETKMKIAKEKENGKKEAGRKTTEKQITNENLRNSPYWVEDSDVN